MNKNNIHHWRNPRYKSSKNGLRMRFQRYLWALIFLLAYLLASLTINENIESPDGYDGLIYYLVGALFVAMIGAYCGPNISVWFKFTPKRK